MEALSFLDTIFNDWKLLAAAFAIGGFYYQAKIAITKIMKALETTASTHATQNVLLDNMNDKLVKLDNKIEKIEENISKISADNQEQAIKLAVLESQNNIIEHPAKRRIRKSQ